jgi:hypothetical protein
VPHDLSLLKIEQKFRCRILCSIEGTLVKKYMLTFFGGNMSLRYENLDTADKEARKKHMAAWAKWMANLSKAKRLEVGYPLEPDGKRIDQSGAEDYRFPDTTEGGFIIINAESLEDAAEIAAEAPIIGNGGHILVRPCGEMK